MPDAHLDRISSIYKPKLSSKNRAKHHFKIHSSKNMVNYCSFISYTLWCLLLVKLFKFNYINRKTNLLSQYLKFLFKSHYKCMRIFEHKFVSNSWKLRGWYHSFPHLYIQGKGVVDKAVLGLKNKQWKHGKWKY